jgi:tetratricopeptide (TPR) repeat protein
MEQSDDKIFKKNQREHLSPEAEERPCESYCMESRRLRKNGKPAEALRLLEQGLRAFPDSIELHYERGLALHMTGETEKALESLENAVLLFSKNMNLLTSIAALYKSRGEQNKAVGAYKVFLAFEQLLKMMEGQSSAVQKNLPGAESAALNTESTDVGRKESESQKVLCTTLERVLEKVRARKQA